MSEHVPVAIVGAGQAGLATSYLLKQHGIAHVVFEKERVGHAWRAERWDSFCLVTPNWQCTLPGFPYPGDDPHGFMVKDEIVAYLDAYAASFDPPVRERTPVTKLARGPHGYVLATPDGETTADAVVVAIGGYHRATLPRLAERVPRDVAQLHSSHYKNAHALPPGAVLVVGTGQSGAQIAEDLHLAGRTVHLCVGGAPRTARRYRGREVVAWLDALGHYRLTVDEHPLGENVRDNVNHYVTGRDGGRDIDLRAFARDGMRLHGHLRDVDDTTLTFGDDLATNLDRADAVAESIKDKIDAYIASARISAPEEPRYVPVWRPSHHEPTLDMREAGITSIVWCVGYDSDYSWIDVPAFDGSGRPRHRRGVAREPGLYFVGLPWQWTWGSGRFSGVADDAAHVVTMIAATMADRLVRSAPAVRGPVEH